MPFKSERISIAGTVYDRRIKLTEAQREEIREKHSLGFSLRGLAREYHVDKQTIKNIVDPEAYERSKQTFRDNQHKYRKHGKEWNETIREHRRYKQTLLNQGLIGC